MFIAAWNTSSLLWLAGGALLGCILSYLWNQNQQRKWQLDKTSLLRQAEADAAQLLSKANEQAKAETDSLRQRVQQELDTQRNDFSQKETRLNERETLINRQLEGLVNQEKMLQNQQSTLLKQQEDLTSKQEELNQLTEQRRTDLENIGRLSEAEAHDQILKEVEQSSLKDAQDLSRKLMEEAKRDAAKRNSDADSDDGARVRQDWVAR